MARKLQVIGFLAILLATLFTNSFTLAAPSDFIQNGGFEQLDPSAKAESWYIDYWNPGSRLVLTDQKARTGKYAAFLESTKNNDIRLVQTIPVKPETVYRFSGWVATENVSQGGTGAALCVLGGFIHSNGVTGTSDWVPMELVFRTHQSQREVMLGVRLGFYGQTATGRAFFDDLKLEICTGTPASFQQISPTDPQPGLGLLDRPTVSSAQVQAGQIASWALKFFGYPTLVILFYLLLLGGLWFFLNRTGLPGAKLLNPSKRKPELILLILSFATIAIRVTYFKSAEFIGELNWFGIGISENISRWAAIFTDLSAAWLIYLILKPKRPVLAFYFAAIFLFLPPLILNSAHWGLISSGYICLLLLAIYFLNRKLPEAAVFTATLALFLNIQGIGLAVCLISYIFWRYGRKRGFGNLVLHFAVSGLILLFLGNVNPNGWLRQVLTKYASGQLAINAGNLITLLNANAKVFSERIRLGIPYGVLWWSLLIIGGVWDYFFLKQKRTKANFLMALLFISFAFACFVPGTNERSFIPVLVLSLLAAGLFKSSAFFFGTIILSLSCFFNLYNVVDKSDTLNRVLYILGIVNTSLFAIFTLWLNLKNGSRKTKEFFKSYSTTLGGNLVTKLNLKPFTINKRDFITLGVIVLCYTLLIFFRLGSWSTPQNGLDLDWSFPGVEVVLENETQLSNIVIYDAEDTGQLQVEKLVAAQWSLVTSIDCKDYYVLKRVPVTTEAVRRLRIKPLGNAGQIKEIAFMDRDNRIIPIKSVITLGEDFEEAPSEHPLFDEQSKMSVKPSYLNSTYFDEIYHGRTAYEFVTGDKIYENTHPPLGKDLLSIGILLFGMNPYGMRFMHAIAGILLIITLFFLGRQTLGTRFGAYSVMLLGFLDFMPFVQSRYSTVDTTSVLFITLMFLFTFKFIHEQVEGKRITQSLTSLAGIMVCFGLAVAVKWTAVYGFAGVVFSIGMVKLSQYLIYRKERLELLTRIKTHKTNSSTWKDLRDKLKKLKYSFWKEKFWPTLLAGCLALLLISPFIYYLSYLPYLNSAGIEEAFSKSAVQAVLDNQKGMFDYHSKLVATHPFASSWWSWPFNFKPLWIYGNNYSDSGMKGTIVSMGNPLIWFCGVMALVFLLYRLLAVKRLSVMHFVFIGFFSLYLPWVLVSRITYIYHFYPPLPLSLVMIAFILEPLWRQGKNGRRIIYVFFALSLVLFIMFYPVLSGVEVSQTYIEQYLKWFPKDWIF